MKAKIILLVLLLTAVFTCLPAGRVSQQAFALTDAERQELIGQIQAQITQLVVQLTEMLAEQQADPNWCHTFNVYLVSGDTDATKPGEITQLKTALNRQGFISAPAGVSTFDATVLAAVKQFQARYGISQTGTVGPITRGKLNEFYACVTSPACTPSWTTGAWSTCSNGLQTRTVTDLNNCGVNTNKPIAVQNCAFTCTPSWTTGVWSACSNGVQTRTVTDLNNCGVTTGKPTTSQGCTISCTPNWQTGNWSYCSSGHQTRTVTDLNNCGVTTGKPATTQTCSSTTTNICEAVCIIQPDGIYAISCAGNVTKCSAGKICENIYNTTYSYVDGSVQTIQTLTGTRCVTSSCTPSWTTGVWSACSNGVQTRTVTDLNNCGVTTGKPDESQSCFLPPTVDIKINGFDDTVTVTRNSDATTNGGPFLSPVLTISYSTSGVSSCSATSNQTTGGTWTPSQINTTYSYTINSAYWWSNKATNTFRLTCTGLNGSTVSDSVVVNTYIPCNPSWQTGAWGTCINGQQERPVTDANNCGVTTDKPNTTQSCCVENWECYEWSTCSYGTQQRYCFDKNNCGTASIKPATTQRCPFCTDSDNDIAYGNFYPGTTVKGTVTDYYPAQPVQYTDQCGPLGMVYENFCLNGVRQVELRGCYNTLCSNGACILP